MTATAADEYTSMGLFDVRVDWINGVRTPTGATTTSYSGAPTFRALSVTPQAHMFADELLMSDNDLDIEMAHIMQHGVASPTLITPTSTFMAPPPHRPLRLYRSGTRHALCPVCYCREAPTCLHNDEPCMQCIDEDQTQCRYHLDNELHRQVMQPPLERMSDADFDQRYPLLMTVHLLKHPLVDTEIVARPVRMANERLAMCDTVCSSCFCLLQPHCVASSAPIFGTLIKRHLFGDGVDWDALQDVLPLIKCWRCVEMHDDSDL
jgi:hypothetical protein